VHERRNWGLQILRKSNIKSNPRGFLDGAREYYAEGATQLRGETPVEEGREFVPLKVVSDGRSVLGGEYGQRI